MLSEPYDRYIYSDGTVKYPNAPTSWPEWSSITGPFIYTTDDGVSNEFYIDLNNCGAPLPAAPLPHSAASG